MQQPANRTSNSLRYHLKSQEIARSNTSVFAIQYICSARLVVAAILRVDVFDNKFGVNFSSQSHIAATLLVIKSAEQNLRFN